MSNRGLPNYEFGGPHPRHFGYEPLCPLNEQASLIPKDTSTGPILWETKPMSPASVKHLYSHIPFNYEAMYQSVPVGTLYDHNFYQTYPTGLGEKKILFGGHYITFPLTNAHTFEPIDYSMDSFKLPGSISRDVYRKEFMTQPNHFRSNW